MSNRNRKRGQQRGGKPQQQGQHQGQRGRRGGGRGKRKDSATFWGEHAKVPGIGEGVRITEDPDAVVRSLGPPPLPGHETIAGHYFAAVYDQAVTLAGALAAAGGLIEPEELLEELGEDR